MINYLYLITRDDGEQYVGVTCYPDRRVWQHKNGYGSSYLRGREFTFEILTQGEENEIYALEPIAIKAFDCKLNKMPGGKAGFSAPGSKNGRAKLTEEDVFVIKILASQKIPQKTIAERFGVSRQTIGGIATGVNWKHVPGPKTYGRVLVDPAMREHLKELKRQGLNCVQISEKTGIKFHTVYSHVREIE